MPRHTVSVDLPEDLYQRVRETAAAVARSVQDVLAASIAMSGAYQLQLSLLNRASGPVQHSHGGGATHAH